MLSNWFSLAECHQHLPETWTLTLVHPQCTISSFSALPLTEPLTNVNLDNLKSFLSGFLPQSLLLLIPTSTLPVEQSY